MTAVQQTIKSLRKISFLGWRYISVAFFAFMAFGSTLTGQGLSAVAFLLATLLCLPFTSVQITKLVKKRWNFGMGRWLKAGLVVAFLFFGMSQLEPSTTAGSYQANTQSNFNKTEAPKSTSTESNVTAGIAETNTAPTVAPTIQPTEEPEATPEVPPKLYKVVKVVDGDTLDVSIDGKTQRLRLIGMDTPETVDPRKPVQCYGKEASNKAKEILTGKQVKLEADPSQGDKDKYDRLLRYVFLESGISFNLQMIQEGYAHEYTYDKPYKYQEPFKEAEKNARENKVGLWADNTCSGDTEKAAVTAKPTVKATSKPVATTPPQTTTGGSTTGSSYSGGDKDCGDFSSHSEAQAFFLSQGGPGSDPHRLDRDNDGLACEDL